MKLVAVISKNTKTKVAETRDPEAPYLNNRYFRGQHRAKIGNAQCIVADEKGRKTTRHLDPRQLATAEA